MRITRALSRNAKDTARIGSATLRVLYATYGYLVKCTSSYAEGASRRKGERAGDKEEPSSVKAGQDMSPL